MEFFRSDDPRRSGTMARDKFGRCLLIMGFRLSPVELDVREREKNIREFQEIIRHYFRSEYNFDRINIYLIIVETTV